MKYQIISVWDRVAAVYGAPQCVASTGSAIRSFGDEVNRAAQDNQFYMHPDDFDLFHLGSFDDQDADWELFDKPKQLALGRDLKVRKE